MEPTLTPLSRTDLGAAVGVFLEAFEVEDASKGGRAEEFWRLISESGFAQFTVARHDQRVIGCGALIYYPSHAWIGFMAVKPELRGKGIGRAIMDRLMAEARSFGIKTLRLDATNWGKPLYLSYGFREEYPVRLYDLLPTVSADRVGPMDVNVSRALPQWCLDMDREAFGDDRGPLLRCLVESGAKVLTAGSKGYGILWKKKVGPIVAESVDAARAIARQAQMLGASHLYIPVHGELPPQFLAGLRQVKSTTSIRCCDRMVLGDPLPEKAGLVFASFTAATG